jgi:hypothetical protein
VHRLAAYAWRLSCARRSPRPFAPPSPLTGARIKFPHSCGSSAPPTRFSYGATHVLGWKRALRCAPQSPASPRAPSRASALPEGARARATASRALAARPSRKSGYQPSRRSSTRHSGGPRGDAADLCAPLVTESCGRSRARWRSEALGGAAEPLRQRLRVGREFGHRTLSLRRAQVEVSDAVMPGRRSASTPSPRCGRGADRRGRGLSAPWRVAGCRSSCRRS